MTGLLQRGAQVVLLTPNPFDGFCLIEGDGQYGYVACQYLSAELVARPRAGQNGVPADRRWVTGTAVNLRAKPARDAEVLSRLAINRSVKLLGADVGAAYCEVQALDRAGNAEGLSGYTACQYLGLEPLPAALASGMDGDPVRAFWRSPGWGHLENHAQSLAKNLPETARAGPWPRDEQLERMKAHLALGLKAAPARPLPDWTALKALAAQHEPSLLGKGASERAWAGKDKDLQQREYRASTAAQQIQSALGLYGPLHEASADGGGERILRLMRTLELPAVQASFFRGETELAPPGEGPQELAGRFGGIYRTLVAARKPQGPGGTVDSDAGLYDMFSRTEALTRPVQQVRLFRDGTLSSEATTANRTQVLWHDVEEPMCAGWTPGFVFGDVDGPIWRYFGLPGNELAQPHKPVRGPSRLFTYKSLQPPPRARAGRSEQVLKLDRSATGFVRFIQMGFDLDGDGMPDLMVLEGMGSGPGHLDGPTGTEDPWYRLLLANVAGAWKVLGQDIFGYGCGC